MVTLLNTSFLPTMVCISTNPHEAARRLVARGFDSAIGHPEAPEVLERTLEYASASNRMEYLRQPAEKSIVC